MTKANKKPVLIQKDEMLPEYDFRNAKNVVRGKYHKAMQQGYIVRVFAEDGSFTETHFTSIFSRFLALPPNEQKLVADLIGVLSQKVPSSNWISPSATKMSVQK